MGHPWSPRVTHVHCVTQQDCPYVLFYRNVNSVESQVSVMNGVVTLIVKLEDGRYFATAELPKMKVCVLEILSYSKSTEDRRSVFSQKYKF